jgi:glutamate synthase (NADPH/NADH) small chain
MSQRNKIPEQKPEERRKNFKEVNLGYTKEQAEAEAKRCLQCKNPTCVKGCPVEINIPGFIKEIAKNNMPESIKVLKDKNNLPAVCGRVCPQEDQCEKNCILAKKGSSVAIGNLERYTADWEQSLFPKGRDVTHPSNGIKIAVVGSGPAGLTCAGDLSKIGYDVTIFESLHAAGGVLRYGIPEFRLSKTILDYEIHSLERLGVKIEKNVLIGRTKSLDDLFSEGFKAVFIGVGAGLPKFMDIPGENLNNIYSTNEFLVRVNMMEAYKFPEHDTPINIGKKVAVIGGGNTAMDSARTALRLGAEEVTLIYRRTEKEMPARIEEFHHAAEEGVKFMFLTTPVKYTGDEKGYVKEMECVKMELAESDESGRRSAKVIPGSNFKIAVDLVVVAIGLSPNPLLPSLTSALKTDSKGEIVIDDNFMTSIKGVFAGGDIVGGETVIQAMGMGKRAARSIDNYLKRN